MTSSEIVLESWRVLTKFMSSSKDPVDSDSRRRISSSRSAIFFLPVATYRQERMAMVNGTAMATRALLS